MVPVPGAPLGPRPGYVAMRRVRPRAVFDVKVQLSSASELDRILTYAAEQGLSVQSVDPTGPVVTLRGAAAVINSAFHLDLRLFQRITPRGARAYRGYVGRAYVPAELDGVVLAVTVSDLSPEAIPRQ